MRQVRLLVGLAVLIAGLVLAWQGGASSKTHPSGAEANARQLDKKVTKGLNNLLKTARSQLVDLSKLASVRAQDATTCNADMAAHGVSSRYTAVGAANLNGDLYCLFPRATTAVNIADRPYFLRSIGTKSFGVGDFQIGRSTGINSIGLGYPAFDSAGAVNGIVLSPLSLTFLATYLTNQRPAKAFDVLIVDDHGTVLGRAGKRHTPSGKNLGSQRLVDDMINADRGAGKYRIAGTKVFTAWDSVPLSDGATHVAVSVKR